MASVKNSPKVEKSTTEKKATSSKSKPDHPKYMDMIREAIVELKDRTGSSRQAIKKYILSKYTLTESVAVKQINLAIKRGLDQKILYCPQGHSNSYKLFKQAEKPKPKKPVAKKVADIKEKKKTTAKKASSKAATTKKASSSSSKKAASSKSKSASTKKAAASSTKKSSSSKASATKKAASSTKKTIKKKASAAPAKKAKSTKSKSK